MKERRFGVETQKRSPSSKKKETNENDRRKKDNNRFDELAILPKSQSTQIFPSASK